MWPGSMKGYIEAAVVIAEAEEAATDPASSLHISLEVTITEKSLSLDPASPHPRSPESEKIVQRFLE